jgi:hypothetical protein
MSDTSIADDLLRGVKPISAFLGESERRVFYLLERGLIPGGKIGASWVASKTALREHFAKLTGAAA